MQIEISEDLMIAELFEALPESVLWFKPVTDADDSVVDFEVAYCNKAACDFTRTSKEVLSGQKVRHNTVVDEEYTKVLFKQCLTVWETGKPLEDTFYNKHLRRYFTASRSKIMGGVLSVTRDRTEYYIAEKDRLEQAEKFTGILDASADGVMLLEAIRNNDNDIVDFRLNHCNKAGFCLAKFNHDSIGKTLLELLPHLHASQQLELHKQVVITGTPVRIETTFRNRLGEEFGWFIVSLVKLGDSVVSTFIDISEKKKNEEQIEEQAQLLNSIFEASTSAVFACDAIRNEEKEILDLRILKINECFTKLTGRTAQETEGQPYLQIFPSAKSLFETYSKVIETGDSFRSEIFYDGERIRGWFEVSAVKRGNNGIVVTFADVSQSKIDKQALEESARYLQDVIDSTQTGICLLTPVNNEYGDLVDFRFKTVNQVLASYAGKKPADLIGTLHNTAFPVSSPGHLFPVYKKILQGNENEKRFENHFIGNGIDAWFDLMVKKRKGDLLITLLDITPLKILQFEISSAADKLNKVINTAQAGMFTMAPIYNDGGEIEDFRFVIVNKAVASYIGETSENLTGAIGSTYFPAYKTNGLFDIYKDTFLNDVQHQFDFHYEDGYDVFFNIHTVKAGNEVLVTFTDHTTLKRLQRQLQASIDELKHSNANLEEFAYAASHDLQEPLRKIHYFSERLRKGIGDKLAGEENRMFERMESAAKRMSQLINDLLTYSQVSRNKGAFYEVNLKQLAQQAISDLETTILEKKANVTLANLPVILGNDVQLRQLFQNLLSNSLKYSQRDQPPVVAISCTVVDKTVNNETKKYYKIEITDNGIGFEQEHADRIFKVFHRLHGQSEYPGTGIGLAIVQKVVQNHNGTISAESQPGKGAKFIIHLPELESVK